MIKSLATEFNLHFLSSLSLVVRVWDWKFQPTNQKAGSPDNHAPSTKKYLISINSGKAGRDFLYQELEIKTKYITESRFYVHSI